MHESVTIVCSGPTCGRRESVGMRDLQAAGAYFTSAGWTVAAGQHDLNLCPSCTRQAVASQPAPSARQSPSVWS